MGNVFRSANIYPLIWVRVCGFYLVVLHKNVEFFIQLGAFHPCPALRKFLFSRQCAALHVLTGSLTIALVDVNHILEQRGEEGNK
jgi:hypothetical protein